MSNLQHIYITDPYEALIPGHDSTMAMMREAIKLGIEVYQAEMNSIYVDGNILFVQACQIQLIDTKIIKSETTKKFNLIENKELVVWMRKDPPVDQSYIIACQLLRLANCTVVNNPNTLMSCDEKLLALEFPQYIPETNISCNVQQIKELVAKKGKLIAKPIGGKAGEGIVVLKQDDKNKSSLIELLTERGTRKIIVQEYLPEAEIGDKRIFLLNGKPIGALLRVPSGDYRANMAAGGNVAKTTITPYEYEMCEALTPRLLELGLSIVGIDVIGNKLTEINITSPTCLEEIAELDSINPAKEIAEWSKTLCLKQEKVFH